MRCNATAAWPYLISVFISVSSRRTWAVARLARWTSSWGSLRGTWSVASDTGYPQQRRATRLEAEIRWACHVFTQDMSEHAGRFSSLQGYSLKCACIWTFSHVLLIQRKLDTFSAFSKTIYRPNYVFQMGWLSNSHGTLCSDFINFVFYFFFLKHI